MKNLFRNALPPDDGDPSDMKRELIVRTATYAQYIKYIRQDKLLPVRFKLFLNKLNLLLMNGFTSELGQAWQQLVQQTNQAAMKESNKKEALLKKHTERISFLHALIAYLPGGTNTGATGAGE